MPEISSGGVSALKDSAYFTVLTLQSVAGKVSICRVHTLDRLAQKVNSMLEAI